MATNSHSSRLVRERPDENKVFLARISMGAQIPQQPRLPFEERRCVMVFDDDNHPFFSAWNNDIEARMADLLDKPTFREKMAYLTAVRVGYSGLPKEICPLTVLIAVLPGCLDTDAAHKLLDEVSPLVYQYVPYLPRNS